jgi:hypothetical protein
MPNKKFMIIDPCYIMDELQYSHICRKNECAFEEQKFPLFSYEKDTDESIIFHTIISTGGDGCFVAKDDQTCGVDSGMLSIVESEKGWDPDAYYGAIFDTLKEAETNLDYIKNQF